jgi:hypothetical protein
LHLHAAVCWFDVPLVPTRELLARASMNGHGCLSPAPADRLRIWLAEALFQELSINLSALVAVRELLRPEVIEAARDHTGREGWHGGFDGALAAVTDAIYRLDLGLPVRLPLTLPVPLSVRAGAEHAYHLARAGHIAAAARQAALRLPLIIAKKRREWTP